MPYGSNNRGFVRICLPQKYALSSAKSRFTDDFGAEFLHEFIIASDGSSPHLALPVPAREESLHQKNFSSVLERSTTYIKRPFSRYKAEVTASDGSKFSAFGVNVFADTTAFLRLTPTPIFLPPPALWFPDEVEKEAILENIYTPQKSSTIPTVLTLYSDKKSEIKTISKTDYANIVISKAVYPTWNRCGLNVLSILLNSLLLSRLPYRIPCYYYPIYNTVANAVKETATLYATDSSGAPICYDGLFSNQEMLWEIESLAERGFSPLDIIRKLFGNDSRIMESKETVQTSADTSFLKSIQESNKKTPHKKEPPHSARNNTIRVSGISVLNLQNCLNTASKYIASVPHAGYGGALNEATRHSLRCLQKYLGLNVTGESDDTTRDALFNLKETIDNGSFFDYPGFVLKFGSCGREVKRLKNLLSVLSKKVPHSAPKSCDEIFDSDTEISLIRAQRALGCLPTGKADKETWEKIVKEIKE